MDEPGYDAQLRQLLLPGLGPNIMSQYVSGPVHPVPGTGSGHVLQQVLHGAKRQVAPAIGAPVASFQVVPHRAVGLVTTAEGFLTVHTAPGCVLLPREPTRNTRPMEMLDAFKRSSVLAKLRRQKIENHDRNQTSIIKWSPAFSLHTLLIVKIYGKDAIMYIFLARR